MTHICLEPTAKILKDANGIAHTEMVRCNQEVTVNPTLKVCAPCVKNGSYESALPHYHKENGNIAMGEWKENATERKMEGQWCKGGHPNAKRWD